MAHDQNPGRKDENRKAVMNMYALFAVTVILMLLPYLSAALLSLAFLLVTLSLAYRLRGGADDHSFAQAHARYMVRTIWVSGLIALIGVIIASVYMLGGIQYAPFEACANELAAKGAAWAESAGYDAVYAIIEPCVPGFIETNKILLLGAVLISGGPVLIYSGYRFGRGLARAAKGYTPPAGNGWL